MCLAGGRRGSGGLGEEEWGVGGGGGGHWRWGGGGGGWRELL